MDFGVPLRPGDLIDGKYRVEALLGQGGMGVVLSATHLALGQPVALKLLRESAAGNPVLVERFLREARASFRLRSENTVRVLDVGQLPTGLPYMVMERLDGMDLRQLLEQRGGALPEAEAVGYVIQVAGALQEAHALGIVHRDLKPRNLFLTRRADGTPMVKVLDFGISKVLGNPEGEDGPLTQPQMAIGSPRYMAPEQWKASPLVDARADIYALGIILYELLTGQVPLHDVPIGELMRRMAAGAMPSPRELRPDVSEAVAKVVLRALRPHPEERFQTVGELATALAAARPKPKRPPSDPDPLSTTSATAVVPREVLEARARALGMPLPSLAEPPEGPSTRREGATSEPDPSTSRIEPARAPAATAPAAFTAPVLPPEPSPLARSMPQPNVAPMERTMVSTGPAQPIGSAAATMQSAVSDELRARLEERPLDVDEMTMEDQTRVDPRPFHLDAGTLHSSGGGAQAVPIVPMGSPMSPPMTPQWAPPSTGPVPTGPAAWAPPAMVLPQQTTVPAPRVTAPRPAASGRAGTVLALLAVIALGALVGGGLALFFMK